MYFQYRKETGNKHSFKTQKWVLKHVKKFEDQHLIGTYNPHFKNYTATFFIPNYLIDFDSIMTIRKSMELLDIRGNLTIKSENVTDTGTIVLSVFVTKEMSEKLQIHGKNSKTPSIRFGTELIKYQLKTVNIFEPPLPIQVFTDNLME